MRRIYMDSRTRSFENLFVRQSKNAVTIFFSPYRAVHRVRKPRYVTLIENFIEYDCRTASLKSSKYFEEAVRQSYSIKFSKCHISRLSHSMYSFVWREK